MPCTEHPSEETRASLLDHPSPRWPHYPPYCPLLKQPERPSSGVAPDSISHLVALAFVYNRGAVQRTDILQQ
eukprot:CAMPEP_0174287630 /NCGR_PEP_ID=MMETSP0809-20121228/16699_1 /TAXON_ID=73025 ORGANISM="Eutreptiella gymnastica-like, Strain CCMP1594" /NCGR_SAMPLE_ID=MMETSP0809 /ASSEMBLY_ACC=CAM_ASM_000658 /LENGTH=71 /DNA_ID=CAMNT_0015384285 /DNA_START=82 /DNA_END=297 /DNA_ORIENTATION=+